MKRDNAEQTIIAHRDERRTPSSSARSLCRTDIAPDSAPSTPSTGYSTPYTMNLKGHGCYVHYAIRDNYLPPATPKGIDIRKVTGFGNRRPISEHVF